MFAQFARSAGRGLIKDLKGVWEGIKESIPDADTVFAYDTVREVRVLDRRLGIVYYFFIFAIFFYIIVGVFAVGRKHIDSEKSMGWILPTVLQPAHSLEEGLPFDIFDSVTNPGEQGAVFIPTRIVETKGQAQSAGLDGFCASPLHPCETAVDCDIGQPELQQQSCVGGMCMRRQWCPAENPGSPLSTTKVHHIGWQNMELWFKSNVHFHRFKVDVSTTDEKTSKVFPKAGANTFRIKDIVRMANLKVDEVAENGAIIVMNSFFKCDFDHTDCEVSFRMANVDTKTGFNYVHNHYYLDGTAMKRDTYRLYGIRLAAFATGVGERISFSLIVMQLSSAIALLAMATSAADFVLAYIVPERRHYLSQKIITTEDLNPDD